MADVFGRKDSPFQGAFSADSSKLNLGTLGVAAGTLVQNLQVNYTQTVNQIFEVGSSSRYYVVGRTNGTVVFGRIVGPTVVGEAILAALGNVCNGDAASHLCQFTMTSSACNFAPQVAGAAAGAIVAKQEIVLTCEAVVATSVGYSVQAQDMLVNENVQCICGQVSRRNQAVPLGA